jgi:hypothetical protein
MKYLKKYNEASDTVKWSRRNFNGANYKFRRDILPSEIKDILLSLKDELIHYEVTFPTMDLKKVDINLESIGNIKKENIKTTLQHLIHYLNTEGFELSYYWTTDGDGAYITTPEFKFDEFFDLLPYEFPEIYLTFTI